MITLPGHVIHQYERFTCYNSPYVAHNEGCAIDLYPLDGTAPSPVAGEVLATHTVQAPNQPYAAEKDHLIIIDTEGGPMGSRTFYTPSGEPAVARIMHVDPAVEAGDEVAVGDSLGDLVRAGFFAPWVDNHLHVGFRDPDANHVRASGSLPLTVEPSVEPLEWDGTGTVIEVGETFAMLDAPVHPDPGEHYVGIAADTGDVAVDGGLPHFPGGGLFGEGAGPVSLLGTVIGAASSRQVAWEDITITANGEEILGLSLFAARDEAFGARLVCPERDFAVGETVQVEIEGT